MEVKRDTKRYSMLTIRICIVLILGASFSVFSQQDSQYTQYMYNTITINPAYAGSRGVLSLNGIYRSQWVGLDGAPETINFSANSPVGLGGVGVGLSFVSDKIGPSTESLIAGDFSYTIRTSQKTKLSFGLKAGVNLLDVDMDKLNSEYDPSLLDVSQVSPLIGAGVYLHSDKWYVGLSTPNFLKTDHYDDVSVSAATERAHVYLIGGYIFELSPSLKFKPAVLAKAVQGAPVALDLSANFLIRDRFTLGGAYRFDAGVSFLAGFQISNQLMLGYAYDYDTTELGNYNSGSHEIFLRFELGTSINNRVNPRFF